jgi:hypothetical protein
MWRALFLAVGLFCCLLGVQCLLIEKAVLVDRGGSSQAAAAIREIQPAEWAPWSLLAAGTVVMLYSITLPKKLGG